jgi:hypothetical protein
MMMDAEFFIWYGENHDFLTDKFDEIYVGDRQFEILEDFRVWEEFVHSEYAQYLFESQCKITELKESTAQQLRDVDWEGQYGTNEF